MLYVNHEFTHTSTHTYKYAYIHTRYHHIHTYMLSNIEFNAIPLIFVHPMNLLCIRFL